MATKLAGTGYLARQSTRQKQIDFVMILIRTGLNFIFMLAIEKAFPK